MAQMMIAHIDKKRRALGIDKARERVLMDMSDRRALEAALLFLVFIVPLKRREE